MIRISPNLRYFLLGLLVLPSLVRGDTLPNAALILTHTTGFYHTDSETQARTHDLVRDFHQARAPIIALFQTPINEDPDWYGADLKTATETIYSRHGEHPLIPSSLPEIGMSFEVTLAGGYHSACLGWSIAELISRFVATRTHGHMTLHLPLEALYSGFLRHTSGALIPKTPAAEAILDESVDGLNYLQVSAGMNDAVFKRFMSETLDVGVFDNYPIRQTDMTRIGFTLRRNSKNLRHFAIEGNDEPWARPLQVVFNYF